MKKKLTPILLLTLVNVIGFSLLIPVIPEILQRLTGKSSGVLYGMLFSSYAFSQFLAAPILGSLSDRYGRRPVLIFSQLGTLLSWVIFASAYFIPVQAEFMGWSLALIVLMVSRIIDGLTGGNVSVAQAWVSDKTTKDEKAKAFGLIGAIFGVGFLIGPAIGGFTVSTPIHFLGTALFAFLLSLVTLGFIYWGLEESLPKSKRHKHKFSIWDHMNFPKKFNLFHKNIVIKNLLWVRVFFSLAFVGFTTAVILMLGKIYGLGAIDVGLSMSVIGVFSIFNQGVLVPRFAKRFGSVNIFFTGLFLSSPALGMHFALPYLFEPIFEGLVIVCFFSLSYMF